MCAQRNAIEEKMVYNAPSTYKEITTKIGILSLFPAVSVAQAK